MTAFPSSLTFGVLVEGYDERREINRVEFKPETGRPIRRRRTSITDVVIPCQAEMTSDEWDVFDNFFHVTLADGALPFTWTHPRTGQAGTFLFEGDPPHITQSFGGDDFMVGFTVRAVRLTGVAPGLLPALMFNKASNSQYLGIV